MRAALIFAFLAAPAFADTIEAPAAVTAVTLYPSGATVTRAVTFTAPAGMHEVLIPGLPAGLEASTLRVAAPPGVQVSTMSLATARAPATEAPVSPAVRAAVAEVDRLETRMRDKRRAIAAIRAKGEAAEARAAFLQSLATTKGEDRLASTTLDDLRALAALVGEEVLTARTSRLAAEDEAVTAELALRPDIEALDRARAALAALVAPDDGDRQTLTLSLRTDADGPVTLTFDSLEDAGWQPVYDLRLTRHPDAMTVDRGVLVRQDTGEDWRGVTLTLSTATPSDAVAPSRLWPDLRSIVSEVPPSADNETGADGMVAPVMEAAPMATKAAYGFDSRLLGQVFTYTFSAPVDIRTGVDGLRLAMDAVSPDVTVLAEGAPILDETAFLVAEMTNSSGQPFLPGPATLYAEGALVGQMDLDLIAAGAKQTIGFGPIQGLRLNRIVPGRTAGQEGFFTSANRSEETAVITVENLTDEVWPLRLTDRVPYSEQDDLKITYTATPPETEKSPEGQRGLLVWAFDLAPGAKKEIRVQTRLDWPKGMVLR